MFYSDGVIEAENSAGKDFGMEGLLACCSFAGMTPDGLIGKAEHFTLPEPYV